MDKDYKFIKLKTKLHNFKNLIKIFIFSNFRNTIYSINEISSDEITLHHHLGLGDAIICNGIVNYLTKKSVKVNLPVLKNNYNQLSFLYSENKLVNLIPIEDKNEIYKTGNAKQILRVGYEKNYGKFNKSFYTQLCLPYNHSFKYFCMPVNIEKEKNLKHHLFDFYGVDKDFILVHNTSSYGSVDLNLNNDLPAIFVEKKSDIFQNMFLYRALILEAKEIHCIDSSFLHLVERVETNAKLYFHKLKQENQTSEKLELYKNWDVII